MSHTTSTVPYTARVDVELNADGQRVLFTDLAARPRGKANSAGFCLQVTPGDETLTFRLRRADGKPMDVEFLDVRFTVPLLNFSRVILPDCGREYLLRDKSLYLRSLVTGVSAPNDGHPFVALLDQTGALACSYGLLSHLSESTCRCLDPLLSARKALRGGHDVLTLGFRLPSVGWRYGRTAEISETLFLGGPATSWFHALRRYASLGQKLHRIRYPRQDAAWEPSWCTWTAWCSDRLSEATLLENARIAKDLGIRTVILDDGWFGPGLDTDDQPLNIGDYYPDPSKFSNLARTVKKLHALEQRVLLWYAPTCIAPDSQAYATRQHLVMAHQGKPVLTPNGFYNLCPCNPEVRAYIRDEVVRQMRDYGVDGFKTDLYNTLPAAPCDAAHKHDCDSVIDGVHRMMADIWRLTKQVRPDAQLELKQNYGNLLAARYGTMVRAGDTAYDSDSNLWRCFYIQAYAPVTHNDYLACSVHDTPRDVAIMMIKQLMGGVPTFSMDLPRQPAANLRVIRRWLEFYRHHLPLWRRSREPQTGAMDCWQLLDRQHALLCAVFGACEVVLPARKTVLLLNGTGREQLYVRTPQPASWQVTRFDHNHEPAGQDERQLKDGDSLDVPSGGYAMLRRD